MNLARLNLVKLGGLFLLALAACSNQVVKPAHPTEIHDPLTPAPVQPVESTHESNPEGFTPAPTTADYPLTQPTLYDLEVELDYDTKSLAVNQTITYTNNTGRSLDELPILVPPADRDGIFFLSTIQIEPPGVEKEALFHESRIDLTFDPPLAPGEAVEIHLDYQLRLPLSYDAMGYTDRQVRLTDWYPLIPPYQAEAGWIINPPGLVGEHLVYALSDFKLNFCMAPSRDEPIVAASAPVTGTRNDCYQYNPQNRRNISLAISPYYRVATAESDLVTVMAYTFTEHARLGQRAAYLAIEAWSTFTDLYGQNERDFLAIVEADIIDGLETDGLILLSEWYYQTADPSPQNYFELLIIHETAHQWFYGYIHNDQANEPWLDEALATYSEILFYELHHPQLVHWWWDFRVNTYAPSGLVNASIYEFNHYRPYINAVYLRGATFLQVLRTEVGDTAFYQGLQQYIQSNSAVDNFRTSDDFFTTFSQVSDADLMEIVAEYFK
jgi:hypothetical protein